MDTRAWRAIPSLQRFDDLWACGRDQRFTTAPGYAFKPSSLTNLVQEPKLAATEESDHAKPLNRFDVGSSGD